MYYCKTLTSKQAIAWTQRCERAAHRTRKYSLIRLLVSQSQILKIKV